MTSKPLFHESQCAHHDDVVCGKLSEDFDPLPEELDLISWEDCAGEAKPSLTPPMKSVKRPLQKPATTFWC